MAIEIQNILKKEQLSKLSKEDILSINEAINSEYSKELDVIEKTNSEKFNTLVEGINHKIDEQVNNVILENFKTNASTTINKKFYDIVKGMVNLLENSGITTTEKTKELQDKLSINAEKLEEVWQEREEIKVQLKDSEKNNFILSQLKGMKPEIVNAAIDHFKNSDILDVQDELQSFLDGDFSNLNIDGDNNEEFIGEISLDQVQDALKEFNSEDEEVSPIKKPNPAFESLGFGIKQLKVDNSPDVSDIVLENAANFGNEEYDSDINETLGKIKKYNNLGYNFG
jgi:peptidyl-tRNA hydrolase